MLKVQEYLRSGKTTDDLTKELGIEVNRHDTMPLMILNYSQIDSPKTNLIVRECRALVLNSEDYSLVAKSFNRFFNWGEVADEMHLFNWSSFSAQEKVDGSLVIFYNFDGEWHANTRGSFAQAPIFNNEYQANYFKMPIDFTWRNAFCHALGIKNLKELNGKLDPKITYICEFTSLWNKVVRSYPDPQLHLLTCYAGEEEIGPQTNPLFVPVQTYSLNSADDIVAFVNSHPETTFEGVVVKDNLHQRWKIKNGRYLALHKMKGNNGESLYKPANLIPFILENEAGELLATFPEVTECYNDYSKKVNAAYADLQDVWAKNYQIENQKDFALSIQGKTPFTGILFNLRKQKGNQQTLADLKKEWRGSEDRIVKALFK